MKSRDFCFWLQGFAELANNHPAGLTDTQWATVKRHLALVFKHEIDPEAGDAKHQQELNDLHGKVEIGGIDPLTSLTMRC